MSRVWILGALLAFGGLAETVIVDGGDVSSIGQAYRMLNTADGEFDTILVSTDSLFEPRPISVNGTDSLTIQSLRPCRVTGPNRLDLFRITARSEQELLIANLQLQPAWLPPKPADSQQKRRSIEPMHAALRVTLSSELRNFSLILRDVAISASREDGSTVPPEAAFDAMEWHYRDGITMAGRGEVSDNVRLQLDACQISHVTESGLMLRTSRPLNLAIDDCLIAQANRQGLLIDPAGKTIELTGTRIARCTAGLIAKGAVAGSWRLTRCLIAENRGHGIEWACREQDAALADCTFYDNGKLFGAAHSNHEKAGSSRIRFSRCIFAGNGAIAPGAGDQIGFDSCNFVLAGPQAMRGPNVPFPPERELEITHLVIDDPRFASTDIFAEFAFAVTHDGYKALGITGFAEFAGGSPGEVAIVDREQLDTARRRAAAPSERDAANWAWRHRMSDKRLHLDRAESHFRGFLDSLQTRLAEDPDYSLALLSARQACFTLLALRRSHRLTPTDEMPLRRALDNTLRNWTPRTIERFPNGRGLLTAASCGMAAKAYPDLAQAAALRQVAEFAWDDWLAMGLLSASALDQTAALHALLDLAFALDRESELQAQAPRLHGLRAQINNAGFQRSPTDTQGSSSADGMASYWRDDLPGGASSDATAVWSRLAWLCKDAAFANATALLAGGQDVPAVSELLQSLSVATTPAAPLASVTHIAEFADRLLLAPKRNRSDSYLAAWLYERGNAYMQAHPDQLGNIYDFSSGGALLLGHGSRRSAGTRNANTLLLSPPEAGDWQHNSASLAMMAAQFSSKNWGTMEIQFDEARPAQTFWAPGGDADKGHARFNPDGYIGRTEELALETLYIEIARPSLSRRELEQLGPIPVRLQGLTVAGNEGELLLHALSGLEGLELVRKVNEREANGAWSLREEALTPEELAARLQVVEDEALGACLEVTLPPADRSLVLKLSGLGKRFHIRDGHDRLRLSHRVLSSQQPNILLHLNAHQTPRCDAGLSYGQPSTWPGRNQGGQVREAKAELRSGDAWGHFRATNCFGVGSRWLRECVVTEQGFAVVRDVFVGGTSLAGYRAGPVWHLGSKSPGAHANGHIGDAFASAWWQESPPRLFVHMHGGSPGQAGRAVFANSVLEPDVPVSFVSVLVPFAGEAPPAVSCEPSGGGFRVRVGERELIVPEAKL